MFDPITVAVAVGFGLAMLGCNSSSDEQTAGKPELPPKKPDTDGGSKIPPPERTRYQAPDPFVLPQATSEGLIYHPHFSRNGKPAVDLANPVALECPPEENQCYFGAGHEYFSFPADEKTLSSGDIPLTTVADFSPEVDGQARYLVDVLREGSLVYGLYDGESAGIAIRTVEGEQMEPSDGGVSDSGMPESRAFSFNDSVTCPADFLSFEERLWVSAANCAGGIYEDGTLVTLDIDKKGLLSPSLDPPFVTTQKRPDQIAVWDATKGSQWILSANPGVGGDSGLDFFNPDRSPEPNPPNISLPDAAASRIVITPDQLAAFLGSETKHWIFVNDLAWSAEHLNKTLVPELPDGGAEPDGGVPPGAMLADASNPVPLFPPGSSFENGAIRSLAYDEDRRILLATTSNGKIFQLRAPYILTLGGIALQTGFGYIDGHYFCNAAQSEGCGAAAFVAAGALVLTDEPAGVTFLPNARLDR